MSERMQNTQIMEKLLGSDTKLEILTLFHNNPGLIDRIDGVGKRIGRTAPEIEADLKDLVSIGVLISRRIDSFEIIHFDSTRDAEIQELISNRIKRGGD